MNQGFSVDPARFRSIAAAILIHALIGWMLIRGLTVAFAPEPSETMTLIPLQPQADAPPPESAESPDDLEEGGAAPPDLRAEAAPIVAPLTPIERPSPVNAAPEPNDGAASSQGGAEIAGSGTGAGGEGRGTGSGAGGNGPGGGFAAVPARKIAGEIVPRDCPRAARTACARSTVGANVYISAEGRVTQCRVMRSSGSPALDAATCTLIRERFRYEPARNEQGQPVATIRGWEQRWWLERG